MQIALTVQAHVLQFRRGERQNFALLIGVGLSTAEWTEGPSLQISFIFFVIQLGASLIWDTAFATLAGALTAIQTL